MVGKGREKGRNDVRERGRRREGQEGGGRRRKERTKDGREWEGGAEGARGWKRERDREDEREREGERERGREREARSLKHVANAAQAQHRVFLVVAQLRRVAHTLPGTTLRSLLPLNSFTRSLSHKVSLLPLLPLRCSSAGTACRSIPL
jgi:hypothetical protein